MESETKFPPDHSTSKGYPWDEIKTLKVYPTESRFTAFNKVMVDEAEPAYVKIGEEKFMHKKIKELACKVLDAELALSVAEEQISDMLQEYPFVPEEFGFKQVYKSEDVTELQIKVWNSELDSKYSLHRIPNDTYGWVLLKKNDDNTFDNIELDLPCHRIAYAAFLALNVKVEGEGEVYRFSLPNDELSLLTEDKLNKKREIPKNLDTNAYIEAVAGSVYDNELNKRLAKTKKKVMAEIVGDYHGAPINLTGEKETDALKAISPTKELDTEN